MTDTSMSIKVLLFARYAELLGRSELTVEVPFGATVEDAISRVRALPGGMALPARLLVARGVHQVGVDTRLTAADELAFLPPMAGG